MRAVPIVTFVNENEHIEWLVDRLLPNIGWTLLYGIQGFGKTTLAMQLCAALNEGIPVLGRKTKKSSILYIQADSPSIEWREMLKRIAPKSKGYTMVEVPSKCLGNVEYVERMRVLIQDKIKPEFIVFDSLYNLTAWPINTEAVLMPVNIMKGLAGDKPWLLIHHPPHETNRAAGHHSLSANCSNEWSLLKTKMDIKKSRLVPDKEIKLMRLPADEGGLWTLRSDDRGKDERDDITFRDII